MRRRRPIVHGQCRARQSLAAARALGATESHIVVRQPVHPGLSEQCPYTVLVVSLDDFPSINVIGNLAGDPEAPLEIGQAVRAVFEVVEDAEQGTLRIQQWELVS